TLELVGREKMSPPATLQGGSVPDRPATRPGWFSGAAVAASGGPSGRNYTALGCGGNAFPGRGRAAPREALNRPAGFTSHPLPIPLDPGGPVAGSPFECRPRRSDRWSARLP